MFYRTSRSFGYGYRSVAHNSQKFRAGTKKAVPVPRVLWHGAYRTHRSSGYGYECPTKLRDFGYGHENHRELPEVPGIVAWAYRTYRSFPGRYRNVVPLPRVLRHGLTDLTEVPGTAMNVVHNLQKFFVRVWMLYRTHRSSGSSGYG